MSDQVRNPEDRFSDNEAHILHQSEKKCEISYMDLTKVFPMNVDLEICRQYQSNLNSSQNSVSCYLYCFFIKKRVNGSISLGCDNIRAGYVVEMVSTLASIRLSARTILIGDPVE